MIKGVATPSWITKRRVIGAFLATLLLVVISFAVRTYAASGDQPAKDTGIVITLHDRGLERVFVTSAATVGDALKQADIEVDARDKVEPALTDQLVANEYTINIYRARPLVVIDGALRQKVITASQVPESIAKDAGITLYPEDVTALRQSDNLIRDGASEQFVVTRATPFTFTLYGETYTARTQAKTVGAMLKEKGISLGENDRTSEPLSTPISKDMSLRVWREGKQTITVDEAVDFEVEKIQDANRPTGYREVKTPGTKGERTVTYEVVVEDGKEVSRVEITSVTKKPAEKQVEIVGTKPEYMPYTGGGSKTEWLSAAGIPSEYWGYADWLVQKESGWNPNATNRSSGACGLAQALPCGKVPGNPLNPIDSLRWMNSYVNGRYGGWSGAVSHSKQKGWY